MHHSGEYAWLEDGIVELNAALVEFGGGARTAANELLATARGYIE